MRAPVFRVAYASAVLRDSYYTLAPRREHRLERPSCVSALILDAPTTPTDAGAEAPPRSARDLRTISQLGRERLFAD